MGGTGTVGSRPPQPLRGSDHGDPLAFYDNRGRFMAWVKVESSVPRNRKFLRAGPAASWLWLSGLCYAQEGLTDGFIPSEALDTLGVKPAKQCAAALVNAGLWDECDGGWQIHDYLDHNKPASVIEQMRNHKRIIGSDGGVASGEARRKQSASAESKQTASDEPKQGASPPAKQTPKQTGNPATATATATPTASAEYPTSTEVGARHRSSSLHDTSHRKHAHCGRICLWASQFGEFVRRRNHDGADMEIREWCMTVEREWGMDGPKSQVETGDSFDFWRERYAETWPADVKPATNSRLPAWAR